MQPLLFASLNRALEFVVELRQGVSRPPVEVEESTAFIGRGPSEPASAPARICKGGGHVGPREDEDVGVKRKDDLAVWKLRDPVARLAAALIKAGRIAPGAVSEISKRLKREVDTAWRQALDDPYPPATALLDRTWSDGSASRR